MKSIQLAVLLFFFSFCAIAQNVITTENPVAKQYLLKHFSLKGKVISVTQPTPEGTKTLYFDTDGRLSKEKYEDSVRTYFNETWIYKYDSANKRFSASKEGNLAKTNYYTLDGNGNVTAMFYNSPGILDVLFIYQKNLLKKALHYDNKKDGSRTVVKQYDYTYNDFGQVISGVYLNEKKDTATAHYYTYAEEGKHPLIRIDNATWLNVYRDKKTWIEKKYYDKKGNIIKEEHIAPTNVLSYEYKLDKEGNWIESGSMKRTIIYRK